MEGKWNNNYKKPVLISKELAFLYKIRYDKRNEKKRVEKMKKEQYEYKDLVEIIETLRGENGCPWDKEQTHDSLLPHLLEESYELVEAINNKDTDNTKEELGDVLLQVLMHAQIAKENGVFTLDNVIDELAKKLVYRHPHVFGEVSTIHTASEVKETWEKLKVQEKQEKTVTESIERIPHALPALMRAQKIQKKAKNIGFFWEDTSGIIDKIKEELDEVQEAIKKGEKSNIEEELGDLLFSVVNLSTFFKINPEFALTKSLEKFINRFRYIENSAFAEGKKLSELTLEEMDKLWEKCKNKS